MRTLIRTIAALSIATLVMAASVFGPLAPSQASNAEQCTANPSCSLEQDLSVAVLPAGSTPPPTPPPTQGPGDDKGPGKDKGKDKGKGKGNTGAGGKGAGTGLADTGPRETLILALTGFAAVQLGIVLTVRSARSNPRRRKSGAHA
jgi:hypothetical protein